MPVLARHAWQKHTVDVLGHAHLNQDACRANARLAALDLDNRRPLAGSKFRRVDGDL